jgi:uncharacterized protein (TIGR03437 family)
LDAAADRIVYETALVGANFELRSYSVLSGSDVLLATGGPVPTTNPIYRGNSYFVPSLTLDGKYCAYVLDNRLVVQPTDGSNGTTLTAPSDGPVVNALISGSGNVVFAATSAGRLLRIDVATGDRTELIAAVPQLKVTGGASVPGARLDVTLSDLSGGDPALVGAGGAAPVVGRSGNTVTLQIPWEATPLSTIQLVSPSNPSLLEQANDLTLYAGEPAFYKLPNPDDVFPYALAAHQDFSGLVSVSSPAQPGEIVHLYFTGLGAVAPAIATGAVTPVGTLYQLQTPPLTCQFIQGKNMFAAKILFAGLAPGMIGVEQVDMQVPAQAAATSAQINCVSQQTIGTLSGYAYLPISP